MSLNSEGFFRENRALGTKKMKGTKRVVSTSENEVSLPKRKTKNKLFPKSFGALRPRPFSNCFFCLFVILVDQNFLKGVLQTFENTAF